jgi:DNA processing protein
MTGVSGCDACLRRSWLVAVLAGRIEHARLNRSGKLRRLLALEDDRLIRAVDGGDEIFAALERFDVTAARRACADAGLAVVCRHEPAYPAALRDLEDAPAALHVAGRLERFLELTTPAQPAAAIVGARRATPYGLEVARALARGLASAGVTVVSGLALGADAAAHTGALDAGGPTIAVLAGGAERPYPPSKRRLYERVREAGCVVSEMPPGATARRWCFPARNRIIAGLAGVTIVVEAAERSGSLITAEMARDLGRDVAAVPGPVTSTLSGGTNALLKDGAAIVRSAEDALDLACGVGGWAERPAAEQVPDRLRGLLDDVRHGHDTLDALAGAGHQVTAVMAGLGELELLGQLRVLPGGRYAVAL